MNNKFWNAPAWSMGNKETGKDNKKKHDSAILGPGSYDIAGDVQKIGCKIGTSTRGENNRENQPGPGNYEISTKIDGPKISIGSKYNQSGFAGNSFTPGPGNYNTNQTLARPGSGVTIGAKYSSSKLLNQQPGPGSYNFNEHKNKGVKIGNSKRSGLNAESSHIPGPGEYTYQVRPYSAGPKYGFGRAGRSTINQERAPGPGQYESGTYLKSNQQAGCTMGQRFKRGSDSVDLCPGPGYYESQLQKNKSGPKIGNAKRSGLGHGMTPGPGAYNSGHKVPIGTKIGNSKRTDFGKTQTPGPGAYNTLKQSRSGVTISGHRGKSRMQNIPGPGAYNPDEFNKERPCSANMGKSMRTEMNKLDTPGPGQYNRPESQNYKFAHTKETRSKDLKNRDPGPGQYDIHSSVPSAPHYLLDPNIYKSYGGSYASHQ